MALKIYNNEIDKILDDVRSLRGNILYMISFEKTAKDNPDD